MSFFIDWRFDGGEMVGKIDLRGGEIYGKYYLNFLKLLLIDVSIFFRIYWQI